MATMYRTQVLLERRQYEVLKRMAREEGRSLSALLRQILDDHLFHPEGQGERPALHELAGLGYDPQLAGRDHDQALYGRKS